LKAWFGEAEEHAAEDKKRREEQETRNSAEQLVYSIEKLIKENDELPEDVKTEVQADVEHRKPRSPAKSSKLSKPPSKSWFSCINSARQLMQPGPAEAEERRSLWPRRR
jgi:hypothetical protein